MIPLVYILINLIQAVYDSIQIKKGILINHKKESILYALVCFIVFWIILGVRDKFNIESGWQLLPLIIFPIIVRACFFDPFLNLFLKKSILYEGVPKSKDKESWFDRQERKLALPTWFFRLLYLTAFITYLIIYLT